MHIVGAPPADRRILRLIGSGGMGVVYEALDERLDRRVALKVLHPHLTMQPEMRDRLLKEAQLAARIEHENVVRIYNVHEVDTGLCLEMQYVDGIPLSQLLTGSPLPPPHAVDLLQQMLEALSACHENNVVHADLKPGNLLVTQDGRVLLADFGIARAVFGEDSNVFTTQTLSGPMWGTPQYCPPEAWEGDKPSASWDVYALGVVTHEALCGHVPFAAETPAMLMREKLERPQIPIGEKVPTLSAELTQLIDRLSAGEPEARPDSTTALKELRQTPEFRASTAATKPLQHRKTVEGPAVSLPVTEITGPLDAARGAWRGAWKGAAMAAVAFLFLALVVYGMIGFGGHDAEPEATPPIAAVGNPGEILDLTAHATVALFSYDDGKHGRELWLADRDGKMGMVRDINPGPGSSNPHGFLPPQKASTNFLLAASTEEAGEEPWLCSNISRVQLLRDIVPGPMSSDPMPVASSREHYLFRAKPLMGPMGMWITDGTHERTGLLRDFKSGAVQLDDHNAPYFVDETGFCTVWHEPPDAYHLVRYEFADARIENLGVVSPDVRDMAVLGDQIVFAMPDPEVGFELWHTSRTEKKVRLLKDIWPGTESGDPVDFYVWNDEIYFRAETHDHGVELWKSDGTSAGTVRVHDINPGPFNGSPSNFVGTTERLYFRGQHDRYGTELWASTGEPGSDPVVFNLRPGGDSSVPYSLARIGNFLCFTADDGVHGEELWALDVRTPESDPFLVRDLRPGTESAEPHSIQPLDDTTGIFVYHTESGHGLMRVVTDETGIELIPYDPLPREN